MGTPILELGNSANWQSVGWSFNGLVAPIGGSTRFYTPFPEIECPVTFNRHILACYVGSLNAKPHWRFGGFLNHKIHLGLVVGGGADAYTFPYKLWVNRITLVQLPKLSSEFVVSFSIPHWFVDANISIWQYVGIEGDSTESMLMDIESQLADIENQLGIGGLP